MHGSATRGLEDELESVVAGRYTLARILQVEPGRTVFEGRPAPGSPGSGPVALVVDTSIEAADHFNRYQEASFLSHPNLARIFETGWLATNEGRLPYIATEFPMTTLATKIRAGLSSRDILEVCRDVLAGLAHLHSEQLVCVTLTPANIWRAGSSWKLSDFSELRVIGAGADESAAADIWLFGAMLQDIEGRPRTPEWNRMLDAATASKPAERPTAQELLNFFAKQSPGPPVEIAAPRIVPRAASRTRIWQWGAIFVAVLVILIALLFKPTPVNSPGPASQPRPINQPEASAPAPLPPPVAPVQSIPPQNADSHETEKEQIGAVLTQWAQAVRDRSAISQAQLYAPVVDPYFGRRNVTAAELQANKTGVFSSIGEIQRFTLGAYRYEHLVADNATVSFDKTWRFGGRRPFWGSAREQMRFRKLDGKWKIVSEIETHVYSSAKSPWNH